MQSIHELLDVNGPLEQTIDGFSPRIQQQEMAEAIAEALRFADTLVAEAGTGTGKTVAYLVPALLSEKKIIISTGTKNLQDQLFFRDLPQVRSALGVSASTALLKGRANYACLYRFQQLINEGRLERHQISQVQAIQSWLQHTKSGDIGECDEVAEDAHIWPQVTSTTDNCLGSECPNINDCYVAKARKNAQDADILVVNHHLFFADLALRDEGFGEILPGAEGFIFDEAHQLADTATQFFGLSLSSRQFSELAKDALVEIMQHAPDEGLIRAATERLEHASKNFRLLLGNGQRRAPWSTLQNQDDIRAALETLEKILKVHVDRSTGIEKCWQRARDQLTKLDVFEASDDKYEEDEGSRVPDRMSFASDEEPQTDEYIQWFETTQRGFVLRLSPTSISNTFHNYVANHEAAWIFTSATLAVGEDFSYFTNNLGLHHATTHHWQSPFDYAKQSLLYLPKSMPEPSSRNYTRSVVDAAIPVIEASEGRAFVLVTSYRALKDIARYLEDEIEYPILVQGSQPRTELLNQFRKLGDAVLVGTSSFWEGVDVKGEALSCVIIDKLPFAAPDEPLLQARIQNMKANGQNPFFEYQIPEAVINLKQGVGRLIRDVNDYGVLMLCDPRLTSKGYGRIFIQNLPSMPLTREQHDVEKFFAGLKTEAALL